MVFSVVVDAHAQVLSELHYFEDTLFWDFGDGIVATGNLVSHNYAVAGVYTVCMKENDSIGNILCVSCDQVGSNPTHCSFTASSNPFHNLTIDFQANSGLFSTVTWDFGDNTSGTGVSVSHAYSAPGSYPVCVTILTNGVSCTQCDTVVVSSTPPGCRAGFIATNLGLTGYFIDMSLSTTANTLVSFA